jgi:hypothetical protein
MSVRSNWPVFDGVDAEVRRELHRATNALRDEAEGAVAEHGGVEGRVEIVRVRHDRPEVATDELRVLPDGLGHRAEDDAHLLELVLEGRRHGNAVEDGVHRHARESLLLLQGDAELLEGAQELGVDLVEALRSVLLATGGRVVADVLEVDGRVVDLRPARLLHLEPVPVGLQTPLEHPLRLLLLPGDEPDHVLVEAARHGVGLDVRDEPVLVLPVRQVLEGALRGGHGSSVRR